ncbi:MAG: PstC family ABC transporter permease [Pseudonocardiaceae bacterium]
MELLAAIPSIVYGLIGIAVLRPVVSTVFGTPGGEGLLTAGLVLAVMVLPTVVAVSIDALSAVAPQTREAAAAVGLTRSEVIYSAVLPEARPGMRAAVLLGLARALGETIAVFLVIGRADGRLPAPVDALAALVHPGQTLTTKLGGPEPVLAGALGAHRAALSALGLLLLVLVAVITLAGFHRSKPASRSRRLHTRPPWRQTRDCIAVLTLRVTARAEEGFVTRSSARSCSCWAPRRWPLRWGWDSAC